MSEMRPPRQRAPPPAGPRPPFPAGVLAQALLQMDAGYRALEPRWADSEEEGVSEEEAEPDCECEECQRATECRRLAAELPAGIAAAQRVVAWAERAGAALGRERERLLAQADAAAERGARMGHRRGPADPEP